MTFNSGPMIDIQPTGPRSENPYCMICSRHLGLAFHETNSHDDAVMLAERQAAFLHSEVETNQAL